MIVTGFLEATSPNTRYSYYSLSYGSPYNTFGSKGLNFGQWSCYRSSTVMYHNDNIIEAIIALLVIIGITTVISWIALLLDKVIRFFTDPLPELESVERIRNIVEQL